jgi:hypothetical protein
MLAVKGLIQLGNKLDTTIPKEPTNIIIQIVQGIAVIFML